MLPIILNIQDHILSLSENELAALAISNKEQDYHLSYNNIEDLRNQVINEIVAGYEEYYNIFLKNAELTIENLATDDKEYWETILKIVRNYSDEELLCIAKAGHKKNGIDKYSIDDEVLLRNIKNNIREGASNDFDLTKCYESYKQLKYFMKDEYVELLIKIGLKKEHLNHTIEINSLEQTFLSIIKSGMLFNFTVAIFIVEKAYNMRIFNALITHYNIDETIPLHPKTKSKNVTIMEDDIIKVTESIKGNFSRVNQITLSKALMRELFLSEPYMPIGDAMRQAIRGNKNVILYNLLKLFLSPYKKRFGRSKTRHAFAPMFYIIFENAYRKNAILTKEGFDEEIEKDSFFPWYNYNKYFTLVDRLVGLDGKG